MAERGIKKLCKADDGVIDEIVDKVKEILGELEAKGREESMVVVVGAALLWYIPRRQE